MIVVIVDPEEIRKILRHLVKASRSEEVAIGKARSGFGGSLRKLIAK